MPTVILCDRSIRQKLPFDVQHRPVIFYRTDSRSGYEELETNIIKWVKNELAAASRSKKIKILKPGSLSKTDLEGYEVAVLSAAFSLWPSNDGGITHWRLEQDLKELKFSEVALALGVSGLMERGFLSEKLVMDESSYNNVGEYKCYFVTNEGIQWLHENKSLLTVSQPQDPVQTKDAADSQGFEDFDDDIPF